jgi:hypothetical protein
VTDVPSRGTHKFGGLHDVIFDFERRDDPHHLRPDLIEQFDRSFDFID